VSALLITATSAPALPTFIDFEASSLRSASYPIEVAWNAPDGRIEAYLISPAGIPRWTDWSVEAEKLHGISRALLRTEGKPPVWICRRMNHQLAGTIFYSDDPEYDGTWLAELFTATFAGAPAFTIQHADDLLMSLIGPRLGGRIQALPHLEAMKQAARRQVVGRHRATYDVQYLVTLYTLAERGVVHG
jgi:hypothetical protein